MVTFSKEMYARMKFNEMREAYKTRESKININTHYLEMFIHDSVKVKHSRVVGVRLDVHTNGQEVLVLECFGDEEVFCNPLDIVYSIRCCVIHNPTSSLCDQVLFVEGKDKPPVIVLDEVKSAKRKKK